METAQLDLVKEKYFQREELTSKKEALKLINLVWKLLKANVITYVYE